LSNAWDFRTKLLEDRQRTRTEYPGGSDGKQPLTRLGRGGERMKIISVLGNRQ